MARYDSARYKKFSYLFSPHLSKKAESIHHHLSCVNLRSLVSLPFCAPLNFVSGLVCNSMNRFRTSVLCDPKFVTIRSSLRTPSITKNYASRKEFFEPRDRRTPTGAHSECPMCSDHQSSKDVITSPCLMISQESHGTHPLSARILLSRYPNPEPQPVMRTYSPLHGTMRFPILVSITRRMSSLRAKIAGAATSNGTKLRTGCSTPKPYKPHNTEVVIAPTWNRDSSVTPSMSDPTLLAMIP